jgi:hypothetical protein
MFMGSSPAISNQLQAYALALLVSRVIFQIRFPSCAWGREDVKVPDLAGKN